jgi:L-fuconolactonase
MPPPIIDTHIHIWDFLKANYSWLQGNNTILNRTYSIAELSEERIKAGITAGVLVQAANNFEDTDWMLDVAEREDWIAGVVGWMPLADTQKMQLALSKYHKNKYFKGARHLIHDEANEKWLLQDEVLESLRMLAANNIPYDVVGVKVEHIQTALKVAEKIPSLRMVFDHLNQPPIPRKEKYGRWGDLMKEAAAHSNFYMKISGLGTASGNLKEWSTEEIKPYVEFALQQFGDDRCFCGGDWPVCLLAGSYIQTWSAYKTILSSLLNLESQQKVFYTNAKDFYDLSV